MRRLLRPPPPPISYPVYKLICYTIYMKIKIFDIYTYERRRTRMFASKIKYKKSYEHIPIEKKN